MNKLRFDENLAIREVLDDIIGMVIRREKLIISASQQAEKARDERMAQHVTKLEELMSDFLVLFSPVLDRVRAYGQTLKESISDSEAYLRSLARVIEAGKTIEGASATLRELEKEADGVQGELEQSTDTLDKIEDLFERTKQYNRPPSAPRPAETDRAPVDRFRTHDTTPSTSTFFRTSPPLDHRLGSYSSTSLASRREQTELRYRTPSTARPETVDRRSSTFNSRPEETDRESTHQLAPLATHSTSKWEETDRASTEQLSPLAPVGDYEDSISRILNRARLSSHESSESEH